MFLQLFSRPALYLLERKSNLDNNRLTSVILNVLASLLSAFPYVTTNLYFHFLFLDNLLIISTFLLIITHRTTLPTVCSQIVSMITSLDHMADITAQLAKLLYDRCSGHSDLVTEIVKDISHENLSESSKTTNSIRNLSHFVVGDQAIH